MRVVLLLAIFCAPLARAFSAGRQRPSRVAPQMVKRPDSPMRGKSKVVLTQDIGPIGGKSGDLATVSTGFFQNFLLPRGLARKAAAPVMERLARTAAAQEETARAALEEAEQTRWALEAISGVTIRKKVGDNGAIFGSVSVLEVLAALEEASGLKLGSPRVTFEAISRVGRYRAVVALSSAVQAEVWFHVAAPDA